MTSADRLASAEKDAPVLAVAPGGTVVPDTPSGRYVRNPLVMTSNALLTRQNFGDVGQRTQRSPFIPRHPKGEGHPCYGRNFKVKWRGTWGPLGDKRSKLSKLARRVEAEILEELGDDLTRLMRRRVRAVADLGAVAEMTRALLGDDKRVTRRQVVSHVRHFENQLAHLRAALASTTPEASFAARVRGNGASAKGERT